MSRYEDTAEGAELALHAIARPHLTLSVKPGPEEGVWEVDVMWLPDDEHATCMVYLAPHPMGGGPFGADFETLD